MELSKLAKLYAKYPMLYKQHSQQYLQRRAPHSLISSEPPIFYMCNALSEKFSYVLQPLFNYFQDRTAYFLVNWWWDMESHHDVKKLRELENQHLSCFPKHKFIHLCNTEQQTQVFHEYDLNAVFFNQNCLIDEKIFKHIADIPKDFDAIYDARFIPYKRHFLAQKINSIAFIYYTLEKDCSHEIKSLFPHAHYFNNTFTKEGLPAFLLPNIVNQCLNACRVGLCLSSVEGAMYASIQYLLSGLPVVSTKSKGGRDVFFDEEYTLIVKDDPDAVKEGVDELIRRQISPDMIRLKTIEKIKNHRLTLIRVVQDIYEQEGIFRDFSQEFESIFFNKLFKFQTPEETIGKIEAAKAGSSNPF